MGKAMVISFFKSNNIGDIALSNAIESIISDQGYEVVKYDFPNIEPIRASNFFVGTRSSFNVIDRKYTILLRVLKRKTRKVLSSLFGEYLLGYIINFIRKRNNWLDFIENLNGVDLVIIGGGNMIMDTHFDWPSVFYRYCLLAHRYNKKINVMFVGAEPPQSAVSTFFYREAFKYVSLISVRDPLSKTIVEGLTNKQVIETIDPVFYLRPSFSKNNKNEKITLGVCVLSNVCFKNDSQHTIYFESLIKIIERLLSTGLYSIILFSTDTIDWCSVETMKNRIKINNDDVNVAIPNCLDDVYELYSKLDYLIGGRMHSMIIAQISLLPFIGVIWQSKVKGFAMVVDSCDRLFDYNDFSDTERMFSYITSDLEQIDKIRDKMRTKNFQLEKSIEINTIVG